MEIWTRLLKLKFHILFALAFSIMILFLIYLAPRFIHVLAYFWPLLLSTALFLVAVVVIGQTSPPASEAPTEKAGEGILEFVAAQPEAVQLAEDQCSTSGIGNTM
ncbi:hypothetical protein RHSIM_Rhsim06G0228800 [Rhododendron simsii]|uniref:Transmembrane protein n=1 Tax=Rhododendron simsii TaxID=118357 RepID=A0A834GTF4_RHOSS|nr:hypothetical protein RHSIM_Rhsim06G0228800 [Rhododendron simsii]